MGPLQLFVQSNHLEIDKQIVHECVISAVL
jgi:hypothetical protein